MFDFFYQFYKKPLGFDLFSRDTEDGTSSPPSSVERITEDSRVRITEAGIERITE